MKTEKIIKRLLYLVVFFIFIYCAGSLKAATLNVTLKNRSDPSDPDPRNLTFSGAMSAKAATPWVMADQYIEVEYRPDRWGTETGARPWGLAIVTDNLHDISMNIAGKPSATGPDGRYGTPDDSITYSGLIDGGYVTRTPIENQDPNFKASLCWQVYRDRVTSEGTGRNTLNTGGENGNNCVRGRLRSGAYTESYNWNSDWAYIIDKKDLVYDESLRRLVFSYDTDTSLFYDPATRRANKYFLVAWGTATTRAEGTWGVLAQHPVVSGFPDSPNSKVPNDTDNDRDMDGVLDYIDRNRNGIPEEAERNDFDIRPVDPSRIGIWGTPDIVIYLGARFCSDRYISGTRVSVLLPPGSYASTIYLELWHF